MPHVVEVLDKPDEEGAVMLRTVPGTQHKTGERDTPGASYSHLTDLNNPKIVEVGDLLGPPCNPFKD